MRGALILLAALAGTMRPAAAPQPGVGQIVRDSVAAIESDWSQAPKYSYLERDADSKRQSPLSYRTFEVLMIDGSPYHVLTMVNGKPLTPAERVEEQNKLHYEIEKREHESARERNKRIGKYQKERQHDHQMLTEMIDAFEFHLVRKEQVDGHRCWVLDAEPKPDFQPEDREGKVLKGMQGTLWIDTQTDQWVKVHAEVIKPVSFYGFLAKVGPGTHFDLEQEPVAGGVWLPKSFNVQVVASALGFFNEDSTHDETYRAYQPMPQLAALLESTR